MLAFPWQTRNSVAPHLKSHPSHRLKADSANTGPRRNKQQMHVLFSVAEKHAVTHHVSTTKYRQLTTIYQHNNADFRATLTL